MCFVYKIWLLKFFLSLLLLETLNVLLYSYHKWPVHACSRLFLLFSNHPLRSSVFDCELPSSAICSFSHAAECQLGRRHTHANAHTGLIGTMPQIAPESHHKGMSQRAKQDVCVCVCVSLCMCVFVFICLFKCDGDINVYEYAAVTCWLCRCQRPIKTGSSILLPIVRVDYV